MRLVFQEGKQKEIIKEHKERHSFTWRELCERLFLKHGRVKDWYYELNNMPSWAYVHFDPDLEYEKYIVEMRPEGWGQRMGGQLSSGTTKEILTPEFSERLAEFVGIVLGDGHVNTFKRGKKMRTYMIKIAGHLEDDRSYLEEYVGSLVDQLFGVVPSYDYGKNAKVMYVRAHGKKLVEFMNAIGVPSGNKLKKRVDIPLWVLENDDFTRACLRGLIDTDGSIFRMSRKDPHLLRINFTAYNEILMKTVRGAFIRLGFHPSKVIQEKQIFLSRKEDVERYLKEIGFANPKHLRRLERFKSPVR